MEDKLMQLSSILSLSPEHGIVKWCKFGEVKG